MAEIDKSEQEWREQLSDNEFNICREKGTERAFTGKYCDTKTAGTYICTCCGDALFDSDTKYDSGSGWPSFYQPVVGENVDEITDQSHGMVRTEVMCKRCGSHLGHKFEDGPAPTGLRYCINSASLKLSERES